LCLRCTSGFSSRFSAGIKEIMQRFRQGHHDRGQTGATAPDDDLIDESKPALLALALLLRARYLVDVDC